MKLKTFNFSGEQAQEGAESLAASESPAPSPRPKRRGRPPSISIRLGQDGKADVQNMSPERVQQIQEAVTGTRILTPDDAKREEEERKARREALKPVCVPLLTMFGAIEAALVQRSRGLTDEQAKVFRYTEGEIKLLEEPTSAVLAKHSHGLEKWSEEITLLGYLSSMFYQKSMIVNQMIQKEAAEKGQKKRSGKVQQAAEETRPLMTNGGASQ